LRSISRMTIDASCASSVQLSALKSRGFTSRMHLQQRQQQQQQLVSQGHAVTHVTAACTRGTGNAWLEVKA
jgi:hypothetical protein